MVAATPTLKIVGVCVDDVGLVEGIGETAAHLALQRRICAASCVVTLRAWRSEGAAIAAATASAPGFELGLHFNLSEGAPMSRGLARRWPVFPGLGQIMALAHLGGLPLAAIADEWQAQVDAFSDAVGREPDFIDGHQHVHHLPGVRRLVLDGADRFSRTPAIRNTGHLVGPGAAFKRLMIEATGGRALATALRQRGLRHNRALLGAYDFRGSFRKHVLGWLKAAPAEGGLLFCHPGAGAASPGTAGSSDSAEAMAATRRREAAYLDTPQFDADLTAAGVRLGSPWAKRNSSVD